MKTIISNYTFNAAARTVTFTNYATISLQRLYLVTNVTQNKILYNFADVTRGGTVATNVLTLNASTAGMANGDVLMIIYDSRIGETEFTTGLATESTLVGVNTLINNIDSNLTGIASDTILIRNASERPTVYNPNNTDAWLISADGSGPVWIVNHTLTRGSGLDDERAVDRVKVDATLRYCDTTLGTGVQLVEAFGDSTYGLWVNVKNNADASSLNVGGNPLTVKRAKIAASSSGVNQVVGAVTSPSKKIRVLSYTLTSSGTVNAKFQSHTTPTDLTGLHYMIAATCIAAPYNPHGHFETASGEALDINLSGAVAVGGYLTYVEV